MCADRASRRRGNAVYDRNIFAFDVMRGEEFCESLMRGIAFGDDQKPGRVLVNAMNYTGTLHPANAR